MQMKVLHLVYSLLICKSHAVNFRWLDNPTGPAPGCSPSPDLDPNPGSDSGLGPGPDPGPGSIAGSVPAHCAVCLNTLTPLFTVFSQPLSSLSIILWDVMWQETRQTSRWWTSWKEVERKRIIAHMCLIYSESLSCCFHAVLLLNCIWSPLSYCEYEARVSTCCCCLCCSDNEIRGNEKRRSETEKDDSRLLTQEGDDASSCKAEVSRFLNVKYFLWEWDPVKKWFMGKINQLDGLVDRMMF